MSDKKEENLGLMMFDPAGELATSRPDFIEVSHAGTENIGVDEFKLPQLKIAQGLSPQMIPGDSQRIEGLQLFDLFNSLTGEIYKDEGLYFIVGKRRAFGIEFDPNDRKIPLDLDVPLNSPKLKWTKDALTGKGVPPAAIKFVEFYSLLIRKDKSPEPIVISIQETNKHNKRAHERLTGFITMRQPPAPIYAGIYKVVVKPEKFENGTAGVFVIDNAGFIKNPQLYAYAKDFSQSLEEIKTIVVQREADPDTFDTDAMDREAASAAASTGM